MIELLLALPSLGAPKIEQSPIYEYQIQVVTETIKEPEIINDPNNCEPAMYWAKEPPYYCIPKPAQNRSDSTFQASSTRTPVGAKGSSMGNLYTPGNCTWYAKSRRPDLPNNLNNARTWVSKASAQGYATGSTPQAGAIGQKGNHVIYVESLNGDGTMNISDMNYQSLYEITYRTISTSGWQFIY